MRKTYFRTAACSLVLLLITTVVVGQSKSTLIKQLMETYTEYGQFNGSILVAENGKVVYEGGFGHANMEWDIPNDERTKHRLGSITKQFTAMLIMQLVEDGKLDLEVPVNTYLPEYPEHQGAQVTLHHLLTHSSGIPNYTSFPGFFRDESRNPYGPVEFTAFFADSTLEFTPGSEFNYSNSGYFLLGVILETVTGQSYEQLLQERIFDPLAMDDTGFDHHATIMKNRAAGYERRGSQIINAPYLDMSIPYSAGSLYSTVSDLFKWDRALYTNELLSQKYLEIMFTPHMDAWGGHYGYGWQVENMPVGNSEHEVHTISHGGGINGFNTLIARVPDGESCVILLNNTGGTNLDDMNAAINGILHEQTYDLPKKSLADAMYEMINSDGMEAAHEYFEANKSNDNYYLSEREMNQIGYQLLGEGKTAEAIDVFTINVEEYPESANVYDSLGEAYLADGNEAMALKYYSKALSIDPNNPNALQIVERLKSK